MTLNVDLTLAVNYLPACACLGKMLIFMLALTAIPFESEVDGHIILAAVLYMDRLAARNIIFDANAVLLAVFFANVHAAVRAISQHRAYSWLVDGMFLFWSMGCLVLIWDPPPVKRVFDRRVNLAKVVPVLLMLLLVVAISHFHCPLESGGVRGCRAVAFTLLSFAWVYIVGIHSVHGIEYLKDNSCQFVARLSPVLYATPWIAAVFGVMATGGFVALFLRMAAAPSHAVPSVASDDLEKQAPPPAPPAVKLPPKADESEEELFRQAKNQSLRGWVPMDPIHEG